MLHLNRNSVSQNTCKWWWTVTTSLAFQRADLLPVTAYKTWWIVGLWQQTVCPVCINTEEVNPGGRRRDNLFRHVGFKSRFKKSLGISWHFSSCYLFSISGMKSQQKAQDVGCSQPFGGMFDRNYCLGSHWGNLQRYFLLCPLSPPPPPVYHLYLSDVPYGVHLLGNSSPKDSRPVPTVSCCHLATSDHLKIYPTIKSFSRNLAVQTWNARQSSSGWATQSQSWTVWSLPSQCHLSSSWQRWWVKPKLQNWPNHQRQQRHRVAWLFISNDNRVHAESFLLVSTTLHVAEIWSPVPGYSVKTGIRNVCVHVCVFVCLCGAKATSLNMSDIILSLLQGK